MNGHPSPAQDLVAEVTAIAVAPGPVTARAQALLEPLHRLVHHDAAWISLLDPERRVQPPLVRHGYDARVRHCLDSPAVVDDMERIGMHRHRPPMRIKDLPVPPAELATWADYLQPAGFGEGIAVPLTMPDGRYLGLFAAHTATSTPPTDTVRDQLAVLAPLIAYAIDPMRTLTAMANLVTTATAGIVLTRGGNTQPLTGLPGHRLLTPGSAVLDEATEGLHAGDRHAVFLTTEQSRDESRRYLKATVLACPTVPPGHLIAVILLAPAGDLHGLTHRDLRILGMLLADWAYPRITAHLRLPRHALLTTVDDIRTKLGASTRAAAVIRAADQGLYLPPTVTRTHRARG
jgi:DNA-binding CsgD family transcriptional regulator